MPIYLRLKKKQKNNKNLFLNGSIYGRQQDYHISDTVLMFFLHSVRNFYNFSTKVTGFVVCFLGGMNEGSNLAHLNSDYT